MSIQLQNLVAGRTKITEREDKQGNPLLEIKTSELTPFRAKLADDLAQYTALITLMFSIYVLTLPPPLGATQIILVLFSLFASQPLSKWLWRSQFRKSTTIIMTLEHISFEGEKGWIKLSRMQKHIFKLREHDSTSTEKRHHDFATRQAQTRNRVSCHKPYYAESLIVVLKHMGQRNDLMAVYQHKEANDVMAALMLCDDHLNNYLNIGTEGRMDKKDDWNDAPGGL